VDKKTLELSFTFDLDCITEWEAAFLQDSVNRLLENLRYTSVVSDVVFTLKGDPYSS